MQIVTLVGAAGLLLAWVVPACGAEYRVSAGDVAALVRAVELSEADDEPDVVLLPAGSAFTLETPWEASANGFPVINRSLTIRTEGEPPAAIIRSNGLDTPPFRLFEVGDEGALVLEGIRLEGGDPGRDRPGGCILVSGGFQNDVPSLVLDRATVRGCRAGRGGGIAVDREEPDETPDAVVEIRDTVIEGNRAEIGGGLAARGGVIRISRTRITGNTAAGQRAAGVVGGGIATVGEPPGDDSMNVLIEDSTIADNRVIVTADVGSDELDPFVPAPAFGGGLADELGIEELRIRRSALIRNVVRGGETACGGGIAGGLFALGFGGTVGLENTTVAENLVEQLDDGETFGGGVCDRDENDWALVGVTLARNRVALGEGAIADPAGIRGGGVGMAGGTLLVRASIVAENTASTGIANECQLLETEAESAGHNVFGVDCLGLRTDPLTDDASGEPVLLSDPGNHGGPTPTMALGAGSPAVDRAPPEACVDLDDEPLATDQRGEPRPQGAGCDSGAYETTPTPPTTTTTSSTTTTSGPTITTGPTTTTTTTTLLPPCPAGANFPSVICRLDDLAADIAAADDLGTLRTPLAKQVTAARQRAALAADVRGSGRARAVRLLRQGAARLRKAVRLLRSKRARGIPPATRNRLLEQAGPLVTDVRVLARNPG